VRSILFLEELLNRSGTATVVLPFPEKDFLETSSGGRWIDRWKELRDKVEIKILEDQRPQESELPSAFGKANERVLRIARSYADRLDEEPSPLAVWDQQPGDGPGGTADAVQLWLEEGFKPKIIDITKLKASS
jgi:hypothetical protein